MLTSIPSMAEVEDIVESFKKKKAPGFDGMPADFHQSV